MRQQNIIVKKAVISHYVSVFVSKRVCITICVCASYLLPHPEMLTDWTVSKSDAVLNSSRLLFLHAAIPLPAAFIILAWCLCMCACLCVPCFKCNERHLLLKSKSGYLYPHDSSTHTHRQSDHPNTVLSLMQVTGVTPEDTCIHSHSVCIFARAHAARTHK